ncbi:MAG: mannose-1-phosphate guanylyltransferase/mannose-6-phosphate isomerase [Aeromonadaceae bacterium]|nr:mannose-1-phosphate guanylyltransferase/mannose-6-phosphate isomerase [Aeromonadaceae bacterium]
MLIPVVLSGGAGTRLWPLSRQAHPKPFIRQHDGDTLLQKTYARCMNLPGVSHILTVTNLEYYFRSREEYSSSAKQLRVNPPKAHYLLEPFGRNTLAAIALAANRVSTLFGPDAVLLILPADHLIEDQSSFAESVEQAVSLAATGKLVTFGVVPTKPETGFGYIECDTPLAPDCFKVRRFVEKPDQQTAQNFIESGRYIWNAGMFCFTAGTMLDEIGHFLPDTLNLARDCLAASHHGTDPDHHVVQLDASTLHKIADTSIDYAIMEKSEKIAVVSARFDWSDIGSWLAMSERIVPDTQLNRTEGDTLLINTKNTYIRSHGRLVATVGVEDLVIVDTDDALLVAHKDHTQDVKRVVEQLKTDNHEAYRLHKTVYRPWGKFTTLEEGDGFKIKRIEVKPGASLSLQMHHHRSEHWIVVNGMAQVTNGDKVFLVNTNESTFIPAGHCHRVENPGLINLIMIEVQSGQYLGEDDIVRLEDRYGRA